MSPLTPSSEPLSLPSDPENPPYHHQFSRHLFLLHSAIRLSTERVLETVDQIDILSPDAHLDHLDRRLEHITNTTLAHCLVEDQTILPRLRTAVADAIPTERPAKRPRTSGSPVSLDLQNFHDDHTHFRDAFLRLREALSELRETPLISQHPPSPDNQPAISNRFARQHHIGYVKTAARNLGDAVATHLKNEEDQIVPMFLRYLTPRQQADLIVRATHAAVSVPYLPHAYRFISEDDLVTLFKILSQYCKDDEFNRIALAVAQVLSADRWRVLCGKVPSLSNMVLPKHNSLIEIIHIHKAITKELVELVSYCQSVDMRDQKQMQSLTARFKFLRRVHSYHAEGEERVLLKELHAKLHSSPNAAIAKNVPAEHDDEDIMFKCFFEKVDQIQATLSKLDPNDQKTVQDLKDEFAGYVQAIADHLIDHMRQEENSLLPLVRKLFSMEDQEKMMRRVMALVPASFLNEVIPWMFNSLEVDDQESMLRNFFRTAPQNELHSVIATIAQSVQKGMIERSQWSEICLRVPEIEENFKEMLDKDENDENGPVSEILRVHKAFRIELNALMRRCGNLPNDGTIPNPNALLSLAESVTFLGKMVGDHSKAEDEILLPRLEKRAPGISAKYEGDHCDERKLFSDLSQCLEELQCASEEAEFERLVKKLQVLARTLRDEMVAHLNQEEQQMWPAMKKLFSPEEQSEIMALIFGHMPCSRLRELLPWMIRILSVSERNTMMTHIMQVTKSTMFETWLKTWLPLDDRNSSTDDTTAPPASPSKAALEACNKSSTGANTALALLRGRDNIERTIRMIAQDSTLSVEDRTRMMQRVMLAPYNSQLRAIGRAAKGGNSAKDDRSRTCVTDKNGKQRLGCRHYLRACKVRAACCDKLYTCRLCHDAEEAHIMDRSATSEILCMRCDNLQGVSGQCTNTECGERFAKYFCAVCVFFDDKEDRSVYHCHSCNVCRIGKGLGIDYFHCMKCNQCMSVKYQKGHTCVEKAMESDCPICRQYLFTSTSPVKHLRCGHLMHMSCHKKYSNKSMSCPVCSKSLEDMTSLYQYLDEQLQTGGGMPAEYRSARCDIYCRDCLRTSNTRYHFLFNKCPKCNSYNTRVENVDANAGETRAAV